MFTGLVAQVGRVTALIQRDDGMHLTVSIGENADITNHGKVCDHDTHLPYETVRIGDSIAINGVCLTVESWRDGHAGFACSFETMRCTTLGDLQCDDAVNVEYAMRVHDRLGGHIVTGHIDGIGVVAEMTSRGDAYVVRFSLPFALMKFVAEKGAISVDGISLTVNGVYDDGCDVTIIPHTFSQTIVQHWCAGTRVNIEIDLVARYVARLLQQTR